MRFWLKAIGLLAVAIAVLVGYCNVPARRVAVEEIEKIGGKALALVDGRQLEYFDVGNPKGPVLCMLHGGLMTGRYFTVGDTYDQLKTRYRIIAPTMPGFGGSSSNNGRTLLSYGNDVKQLFDHLNVTKFVIYGMSWGGTHAFAVAAAMPDRVRGIIVDSPCVPAMPDFPGWTSEIPDPDLRTVHHTILGIPYLNRVYATFAMLPAIAGEVEDVLKAFKMEVFEGSETFVSTMQAAVKYNIHGMCDLIELAQRAEQHLDFAKLGRQLKSTTIRLYHGALDTVVNISSPNYIIDKLKQAGHSRVSLKVLEGFGHVNISSDKVNGAVKRIKRLFNEI